MPGVAEQKIVGELKGSECETHIWVKGGVLLGVQILTKV